MIDLKEMPIDEYNRQLLPESKSTKMGNPAWMICKYAIMTMLQYIFFQSAFIIFQSAFIFFLRHLCYFSEIIFHSAFIFFQSALS